MSLQSQIEDVKVDIVKLALIEMKIPRDSEVGRHVIEYFHPVWDGESDVLDVINPEAIFDFLTIVSGNRG